MLEGASSARLGAVARCMNFISSKALACLLAVFSLILLSAFVKQQRELTRLRAEINHARDIVSGFHALRDLVTKHGVTETADALYSLQLPPGTIAPKQGVADLVERERSRVVADLIEYLRNETGKDMGDAPGPWIKALASEEVKRQQASLMDKK